MKKTVLAGLAGGLIALSPALACSLAGPHGSPCEPGAADACAGPSGCEGLKLCNGEGTDYGPCQCGTGGSGTGGSGTGASGTGASSTGASGTGTGSGNSGSGTGNGGTGASGTGSGGGSSGNCTGTAVECEAVQLINVYRASHMQQGECNQPLQWNANMGQLAHDHQQSLGASIGHSSHGYVENVGYSFGLQDTVDWILEYDPGAGEDHCASNGSYVASHHCAGMYCANQTVGVGVYAGQDTGFGVPYYMTMMFGDASGNPDWSYP